MIRFLLAALAAFDLTAQSWAAVRVTEDNGLRLSSELITPSDIADFHISDNDGPTSTVTITFAPAVRSRVDAVVAKRAGRMVMLTIDGHYIWGALNMQQMPLQSLTAKDVPDETANELRNYLLR